MKMTRPRPRTTSAARITPSRPGSGRAEPTDGDQDDEEGAVLLQPTHRRQRRRRLGRAGGVSRRVVASRERQRPEWAVTARRRQAAAVGRLHVRPGARVSETAVPTAYLLSRPAVAGGEFRQRRRRAVMMMIQGRAAGARHVEESQFPGQEALHGRLVGGVEDRPAGAAAAGHLIAQLQGRKRLVVGLFKVPRRQFAPVQPSRRPAHALRVEQGVLDRQPHVRRRQLRQHRAVLEFHERVNDRFGMDNDVDALRGQVEQPAGLDHLQRLVHQRGRIDGDLRPMRQVGWHSACSTVTSARSARQRPRKGPPLPVRTMRSTAPGGLPCMA